MKTIFNILLTPIIMALIIAVVIGIAWYIGSVLLHFGIVPEFCAYGDCNEIKIGAVYLVAIALIVVASRLAFNVWKMLTSFNN